MLTIQMTGQTVFHGYACKKKGHKALSPGFVLWYESAICAQFQSACKLQACTSCHKWSGRHLIDSHVVASN